MLKTLTHYPTILGASIFIFFGVVYAQVAPDEQLLETEEVATSTPEVIVEETEVATSSEPTIEPAATSTASSSSSEEIASSEDVEEEIILVSSASTTESAPALSSEVTAALETEIVFDSINDITKPSECRNPSALAFFETIGECSRFIVDKVAEEKFERADRVEPEYAPSEEF